MKTAVIGSRSAVISNLEEYLPENCTEIVSGGAVGIDRCAAAFAREHGLTLTEFFPDYKKYGRAAPIVRNKQIVEYADLVLAFWDGMSKGTLSVIKYCEKSESPAPSSDFDVRIKIHPCGYTYLMKKIPRHVLQRCGKCDIIQTAKSRREPHEENENCLHARARFGE